MSQIIYHFDDGEEVEAGHDDVVAGKHPFPREGEWLSVTGGHYRVEAIVYDYTKGLAFVPSIHFHLSDVPAGHPANQLTLF